MPKKITRRAKNPIVKGLNENHLIQKSRPLMLIKQVPFGLGELKVLDVYLSRINSHNEDEYTVRFTKEEYEDLMGIERMRPERLEKYVDGLMGKTVTAPDKDCRGGWRKYVLFDYSECSQDDNGQWWIDLSCTEKAKDLFFNVERVGYIRYQLKNVLPLTSKYSVLLYLYLLDNRFRNQWLVSVDELRQKVLRCDLEFYRNSFRDFNKDILKKALAEANEKTDLTFSMSTAAKGCKAGRKIINVEFTLIKDEVQLSEPAEPDNQLQLDDYEDEDENEDISNYGGIIPGIEPPNMAPALRDRFMVLAGAVEFEFAWDEIATIHTLIKNLPELNKYSKEYLNGSLMAGFLNRAYLELERNAKKRQINSRFKYFLKILNTQIKEVAALMSDS